MLYTFGQYIVNMQWSITGEGFLTIFKFGIRLALNNMLFKIETLLFLFDKGNLSIAVLGWDSTETN